MKLINNFWNKAKILSAFLYRLLPKRIQILGDGELMSFASYENIKSERNEIYKIFDAYFYLNMPYIFFKHRLYFSSRHRGFGENAFHSMWYLLFRDFKPTNCLEIGVYRGQVISLWGLLSKYFHLESNIYAISPFSSSGDSVSKYLVELDYHEDTVINHKYFGLDIPILHRSFSTDKSASLIFKKHKWDLVYIDGCHDYDVVLSDLNNTIQNLNANGLIVMDDSSLYFNYKVTNGGFKGHPGPSQAAMEFIEKGYLELVFGVGHINIFKIPRI